MKHLFIIGMLLLLGACSSGKTTHTVKVIKPINHKGYYKDSRWHKKLQYGRIRIRWFEKHHPGEFDLYGQRWDRFYLQGRMSMINPFVPAAASI